ncbi:DUF2235 domain-containing protein [Pseudoroseicyclus sp. H15]
MPLLDGLRGFFRRRPKVAQTQPRRRGQASHVIVLDGTMSSLREGRETNAGQTFKLIREATGGAGGANVTAWYSAGIQWKDWPSTLDVLTGKGINKQIERAYGVLASRYRPGDRIFLVGFSRGAYAARSLAGMIGALGLLRADEATVRNIRQAFRHYRSGLGSAAARDFSTFYCHEAVQIEVIAAWDTVRALGFGLPGWRPSAGEALAFHRPELGPHIRHAYHALALDETREAFHPVLFAEDPGFQGHVEQMWFRGSHGDIGGQLDGYTPAKPLSHIPLVWMLEKLEAHGLPLPEGWHERFPMDATAPALGTRRGWGKALVLRRRRVALTGPSEKLHPTAAEAQAAPARRWPWSKPAAMPDTAVPGE